MTKATIDAKKRPEIVVLLTATIDPAGIAFMSVTDAQTRLEEYCAMAGKWATDAGVDGLVFCENSGYDISAIRSELGRAKVPVQVCQFNGQDFDRSLGKGYGEMATIRHALENAPLARNARWVVKVNGRYWLRNARTLFEGLRRYSSIRVSADFRQMLSLADSRVFAFAPAFFDERLSGLHQELNDSRGVTFEHVLARAIHAELAEGAGWLPLPVAPIILGRSGTSGRMYPARPHRILLRSVRSRMLRWLLGR